MLNRRREWKATAPCHTDCLCQSMLMGMGRRMSEEKRQSTQTDWRYESSESGKKVCVGFSRLNSILKALDSG